MVRKSPMTPHLTANNVFLIAHTHTPLMPRNGNSFCIRQRGIFAAQRKECQIGFLVHLQIFGRFAMYSMTLGKCSLGMNYKRYSVHGIIEPPSPCYIRTNASSYNPGPYLCRQKQVLRTLEHRWQWLLQWSSHKCH
jgi:hypothetical protein